MKTCSKCHVQVDEKSHFCIVCGNNLDEQEREGSVFDNKDDQPKIKSLHLANRPVLPYPENKNTQKGFFNTVYSLILFFIFFPMIFPRLSFKGFGDFGYGLRGQISRFADLFTTDMSKVMMLLIQSGVIVLIVAVVMAACFVVTALIILNKRSAKRLKINYRLLKIFNMFIFFSFTFIFAVTFPYITFTFICAYTLSFYALLVNLKPAYADDLAQRKNNETKNGITLTMLMISTIIVFCFSPIFTVTKAGGKTSYNYFDMTMSLGGRNPDIDVFLVVLSIIIFIINLILFAFIFLKYLKGGKPMLFVMNTGLVINIILSILVGAYIRMENELNALTFSGVVSPKIELNIGYFVMVCLMAVTVIIYFVQKALGTRRDKSSSPVA